MNLHFKKVSSSAKLTYGELFIKVFKKYHSSNIQNINHITPHLYWYSIYVVDNAYGDKSVIK